MRTIESLLSRTNTTTLLGSVRLDGRLLNRWTQTSHPDASPPQTDARDEGTSCKTGSERNARTER